MELAQQCLVHTVPYLSEKGRLLSKSPSPSVFSEGLSTAESPPQQSATIDLTESSPLSDVSGMTSFLPDQQPGTPSPSYSPLSTPPNDGVLSPDVSSIDVQSLPTAPSPETNTQSVELPNALESSLEPRQIFQ